MRLPVWPKDSFQIIDEDGVHVCFVKSVADRDYIVQAINGHEKRYKDGYEDGLRAYAWWKDGVEYVGSCGTTLKQALREKP